VRLADAMFRGGHLSEPVLVEAVMTGERPVHLDRCDICAERAVELGRWLDQVRETGLEAADSAFTPERLAAQQAQILRRLEQLDQPARVIAFPSQYRLQRETGGHRIAPAWLGVAAAAGVVLGALSGQLAGWVNHDAAVPQSAAAAQPAPAPPAATPAIQPAPSRSTDAPLLKLDFDRTPNSALDAMDEMTPSLTSSSGNVVLASNRSGGF
jgi:hypothetical protein